jgi:hypothetical protein
MGQRCAKGVGHTGHQISDQLSWSNEPSEPLFAHLGHRIKVERLGSGPRRVYLLRPARGGVVRVSGGAAARDEADLGF